MEGYIKTNDRPGDKVLNLLPDMWQEACERGGYLSFRVISGSMEPMIRVGDRVKVSRAEPSRLRIGDIIAFREGQGVTGHRIISRGNFNGQVSFYVRGDVGSAWRRVTVEDLIGKICAIERDEHEILLDTPRYTIANKILGWRLLLVDCLRRIKCRRFSDGVHLVLRPVWRLCRRIMLPRSRRQSERG